MMCHQPTSKGDGPVALAVAAPLARVALSVSIKLSPLTPRWAEQNLQVLSIAKLTVSKMGNRGVGVSSMITSRTCPGQTERAFS